MENQEAKHEVRIHIDQKPYESPNPDHRRGALQARACAAGLRSFPRGKGDKEDPVVENDDEPIHLREDEHFHSGPAQHREVHDHRKRPEEGGHQEARSRSTRSSSWLSDAADRTQHPVTRSPTRTARASTRRAR